MAAVYTLPVLFVILALASRRVKLLWAAAIALAITVALVPLALSGDRTPAAFLVVESVNGAWLAWHAIAVILAGLLFHNVARQSEPALFAAHGGPGVFDYRRLFAACFFLGPFFESATGFGVGLIIVIPFLLRMGMGGPRAVVFGLYSQILVPWGAMAVGSTVGAGLAGLTAQQLGLYSAYLTIPLLFAYLAVFWGLATAGGYRPGPAQMADDVVWTAALAAALVLVNRYVALEPGALLSCGGLLVLRFLRDARGGAAAAGDRRAVLRAAWPYAALTGLVLVTRVIGPLEAALADLWAVAPTPSVPAYAPFYHVGSLILIVALANAALRGLDRAQWAAIAGTMWQAGRSPVLATLIFVVMGQLTAASGMAAEIMAALIGAAGAGAVLATPVVAAVAGLLTGSNVAANAIAMPIQKHLALQAGHSLVWVAAIQNAAGSNFTLISPIRIAMGAALVGLGGREGEIFRQALPIAGAALAVLLLAAAAVWAL